jgi:anti-sigma regulatory factor (Ser/Thr protein kinase)
LNIQSRLLFIGASAADYVKHIQDIFEGDVIGAVDIQAAVAVLRQFEHTFTAALIDISSIEEDLEELVVYIRGTFPETKLVLFGQVPEAEKRRLSILGVSLFISEGTDWAGMIQSVHQLPRNRRARRNDWEVVVDKNDWVEISVPSEKEYVSRIQDLLDLLERSKLSQDTRDELMLALDELVTNGMEWGNRYKEGSRVKVSYYCTDDRVMLKVEDEGSGFNTAALNDPTEDLDAHLKSREQEGKRPGGFGVHMIQNLMDEFTYNDRGNIVLLTKFLEQTQ